MHVLFHGLQYVLLCIVAPRAIQILREVLMDAWPFTSKVNCCRGQLVLKIHCQTQFLGFKFSPLSGSSSGQMLSDPDLDPNV